MASAVYEVGRPARLCKDQADEVDDQWRTFGEYKSHSLMHPLEFYSETLAERRESVI